MRRRRLLLCCVLLASLGGLSVHHGATADDHSRYPTIEALDADYDSYVGRTALLSGRVVSADPANGSVTITQPRTGLLGEMTVVDVDRPVRSEGSIQVYGTLEADHVIRAESVVVLNASSGSEQYKYAVSVVGAVLILWSFFGEWRFDRDALAFEVRDDG